MRYIAALSVLASLVVMTFFAEHLTTLGLSYDGRLVNLAGAQRMLSQKVTKDAERIAAAHEMRDIETEKDAIRMIQEDLDRFVKAHHALKNRDGTFELRGKNSEQINQRFEILDPQLDLIIESAGELLEAIEADDFEKEMHALQNLRWAESIFLPTMDETVDMYEAESLMHTRTIELVSLA
ncbi:MAG: type IV pili methyl-accepting chemotaxis transducer N-terminal domain-containing protein, partial [Planctomycetota bacterium]